MHLRGLFSIRRLRRRSWTTATAWHRSLLSFALPSLQCVVGLFSSFVWTNSSRILQAFFPRKWFSVLGLLPYFTKCIFFCLRGACAQLARQMQLSFSVLDLLDWHILKPLLLEPYKMPNDQWLANWPNPKSSGSAWKHLRQPCANLAPSLCFAGCPCVTPHNENENHVSVSVVIPQV